MLFFELDPPTSTFRFLPLGATERQASPFSDPARLQKRGSSSPPTVRSADNRAKQSLGRRRVYQVIARSRNGREELF